MSGDESGDESAKPPAWLIGSFYALAALLLTWPLAVRAHELVSLRPDALMFGWNSWWFRTSVLEQGVSPLWTDALHHPLGISLAAHTFSALNAALGGVLNLVLDVPDTSRVLLLLHFWWSGWAAYALSRYVTGSVGGALLGGLLWSFSPFHFHYLAQLNHATFEFLPLVCLFLLRTWQIGGYRNGAGLLLTTGLLTASCYYYTAYAVVFGLVLLLGGGLLAGTVRWRVAAARTAAWALGAGLVVALVGWPLLSQLMGGDDRTVDTPAAAGLATMRAASNDLFGFNWRVGGEESVIASWPTMLGYSTLLLLLAGWRGVLRRPFWLVVVLVFFVLGLGPSLHVGTADTGVAMPYAWLNELPYVTDLVRKPDRFFTLVQLGTAVLCAAAWQRLARSVRRPVVAGGALIGVAAVTTLETSPVPLQTFPWEPPAHVVALASMDDVTTVVNLPHLGSSALSAEHGFAQTVHGKKVPGGYITDQAVTDRHRAQSRRWRAATSALGRGDAGPLLANLQADGIDAVVLHRTGLRPARGRPLEGDVTWGPFFVNKVDLMGARQGPAFEEVALRPELFEVMHRTLVGALGPPRHEDDEVALFAR